jgi:hypothetical protein
MRRIFTLGLLGFLLLTTGCASLVEKSGRVLNGSAFAEKTLGLYEDEADSWAGTVQVREVRNRGGEEFLAIGIEAMPTLRIKGSMPDGDGNFFLSSLDFLSPNLTGWNEFTVELLGTGTFTKHDDRASLVLHSAESLDITEGKIRRSNNRITGDQALTALRNRQERILVLTEWLKGQLVVPSFAGPADFEKYWKPILFPELVRKKKRPAAWTKEDAVWVRGEDVRWNSVYTDRVFPEELRPVRNSGTLLRDWEEALSWIYFQFQWDRILSSLQTTRELQKIAAKIAAKN